MGNNPPAEVPFNPTDNQLLWKVEPGEALGRFRLGMPRDEVFELLKELKFETCEEDLDDHELYVMEMEVTLYFAKQSPHPVLMIEAEDERVRFGTLSVLGDYAHNVFSTVAATVTLWFDDFGKIMDPHSSPTIQKQPSDKQLLENGTVWIVPLGVGFRLSNARVIAIYLCDPAHLPAASPTQVHGQFTGAQRHLSEKMQFGATKTSTTQSHPLETFVKLGLLVAASLVAAFFGMQAWNEQKRWDNAPEVEGEVVAVWPAPPAPFPEKYQLSFKDNFGERHQVELGQNDLYGIPQIGERVSLRYLLESPGNVKGPAQLHDIGFNRFVPYLIGTFAVYLFLHFISDWLIGMMLRK